ncbi:hypothetical protein D3C73_869690 [compost metagenome]
MFYQHNPTTTLMRTTAAENLELGRRLAMKVNQSKSKTVVVFPTGGVSLLDRVSQAFEGVEERQALYQGIKEHLRADIPFIEMEQDINDQVVADFIANQLLSMMKQ